MNIDSSYVNAYDISGIQQNSIEKLGNALAINKASDDPAGLSIGTELGVERSSISQSIDNINSGIALSNIAQSGLSEQKELLTNIKEQTLKASNGTLNDEDRGIITEQINKYIEQYENIANSTTYNGNTLLKTEGTSSDDLSIVESDTITSIEKSDTLSISDDLKSFMSDFSTNEDSRSTFLNTLDQSIDQIASYQSDFGSASISLESSARSSINTEVQLATAQSTILDIDYSEEVSTFSKSNLLSQIGLIAQSQANAVQGRSISLLSK